MRYFFLSFNYERHCESEYFFGFKSILCSSAGYPTQKECKDALLSQIPDAKSIIILGITEFATKEDFETFKSEL